MASFKCRELNQSFASKEAMFKALAKNSVRIIEFKKAKVFDSVTKGQLRCPMNLPLKVKKTSAKSLVVQKGFIYPVINTTRYLDSHGDVHMDGIWNKSAKDQNGKTFYVTDHELCIDAVVAWKDDVNIIVEYIDWASVGMDYQGQTQALVFEIPYDKILNDKAKEIIDLGKDVENSIRMQYVTMKLAINTSDPELQSYKDVWDQYINDIANKEDAILDGYFWAITEAKIVKEGSMVIAGSNDATAIIQYSDPVEQPEKSIAHIEPSDDTRKKKREALKRLEQLSTIKS